MTQNQTVKVAYSYTRISTREQAKGEGILRQLATARSWAESHGYRLDESLSDIGVSSFRGANRKRGALAGFLEGVQSGEIEPGPLLVENVDRLSREPVMTAFGTFQSLIHAGVTVVLLDLGPGWELTAQVLNAESWRLQAVISMMQRAHDESRTKSHRSLSKAESKRRMAVTGIPFSKHGPAWLVWSSTGWLEHDERVQVIKKIFTLALDGLGSYRIALALNRDAVPTFGGAATWQSSYVSKILRNEAVLGVWKPHRLVDGKEQPTGERIEGHFPSIIEKADWLKVQREILPRNSPGQKGKHRSNLFSGKCFCTLCGWPMALNAVHKGGKKAGYLVCTQKSRLKACKAKRNFRCDVVEDAVLSEIHIDLGRMGRDEAAAAKTQEIERRVGGAEYDRGEAKRQLDTFTLALAQAKPAAMQHLMNEINARATQIEALDEEIATLGAELARLRATPKDLVRGLTTLKRKLAKANDEERYALRSKLALVLGKAITRIDCDPDGFEVRVAVRDVIYIFSGEGAVLAVQMLRFGEPDEELLEWAAFNDCGISIVGDRVVLPSVAHAVHYRLRFGGVLRMQAE
ncbi:Site-specific DNA recombinase [Methylobacterium sp. ap11]|uniref:recombinase family protein n=1 Tax=Methylobacterium sp. ap11 TaxID=1761799 RepID=UPI0008C88A91|nr:recombinase family protein [Methylobacterium sp. ap11]SEO43532.1 Site-specific DNA recombinase [Methylobacterium sp. ap11]